jgi:predicted nucleotide-binding protein
MTRRPKPPQQPQTIKLSVNQMHKSISRFRKRIEALKEFDPIKINSADEAWTATAPLCADIDDALTRTFGENTTEYYRYSSAAQITWSMSIASATPLHQIISDLTHAKLNAISLLESAIRSLEEQIEEANESAPTSSADFSQIRSTHNENRKIFVVHGHDVAARESVARFLDNCAFKAIILHEQASKNQSIIEKLESNANVGFAVVLLTPDDEAKLPDGTACHRARQNVILELGYFVGKLGRDKVCVLKSGEVDIPSDMLGVVWIQLDPNGAWKVSVAKELEAAGYQVDWNAIMSR